MTTLLEPGSELRRLFTGTEWGEGPVWLPESASVRWSDIPNNRIMQWESRTSQTRVYREDVEYTNGRTLDLEGRVLQCSHGRRSVEREVDGQPQTIVDSWNGHPLNSPNDIVVASDGTIWFTDPPYGIQESGREGHPGEQEYDGCFVFRLDETSGELRPVITDMVHPNGLAFSPDESVLYVSDTSDLRLAGGFPHIRAYDIVDGACVNGSSFARMASGVADGFRVDVDGRVWTSAGEAVEVYSPAGERLLTIAVPERVANVCFGGKGGRDLYVTASSSLYVIRTTTTQAARPAR
ncbi:SMP-30/gluconolactonase/LRE family protein [Glaciihabitans sp. UYNi722]|uniref:SMP-30/gluconolactonase/LRE family protein n=1 Tax=Glaciihabitans sp. UYNi722 TaxID=3156344 RepID=UPI003397C5D3